MLRRLLGLRGLPVAQVIEEVLPAPLDWQTHELLEHVLRLEMTWEFETRLAYQMRRLEAR